MKKFGRKIAITLLGILFMAGVFGLSACSSCKKHGAVGIPEDSATYRAVPPQDGSTPESHTALENIGYMAYVLDNQPFYHAYARNSSMSMKYEQITQTWKDYKSAELSGVGQSVMICSDLSYSSLVKSSSQSCFIGSNEAHFRSGNKPGKSTTPNQVNWSTGEPEHYNKSSYHTTYGEFSTEISVFVLNEDTIASDINEKSVVNNGDGTYSQTVSLKQDAACWYQYGMKTRGGLKDFPEFKSITLTLTFDNNWRVLSTYCEEKASIKSKQLGGISSNSTSKTTTTYYYGEEDFDNAHYAYFEDFFLKYKGENVGGNEPGKVEDNPGFLDVLAGGFGKVLSDGQQFALNLKIGQTNYDGKVFLKLNPEDVLGTLDARLALEKQGSGKQDLYAEFKNGAVNVYYSTDFALTADINKVKASVENLINWINSVFGDTQEVAVLSESEEEESGLDLAAILGVIESGFTVDDTSAKIVLNTDDLAFGIGIDADMSFSRTKGEDGSTFDFKSLDLNKITYKGTEIALSGAIRPDDTAVISRDAQSTPADLADYVNSVYNILNSKTAKVELGFTGGKIAGVDLTGLTVDAVSYVKIARDVAAKVDLTVGYNGDTVSLTAYYVLDGAYGKVYLNLNSINGTEYGAKLCCDVKDTIDAVYQIINTVKGSGLALMSEEAPAEDTLAKVINSVLNLNFGKILKVIAANDSAISVTADVDELLSELGLSIGVSFGDLQMSINSDDTITGSLSALGVTLKVSGSDNENTELTEAEKQHYVDVVTYIGAVTKLLASPALRVQVNLSDFEGITADLDAYVSFGSKIAVAGDINVKYDALIAKLYVNYVYGSDYGTLYINTLEIGEGEEARKYTVNVVCDIKETVTVVKQLIDAVKPIIDNVNNGIMLTAEGGDSTSLDVATIIAALLSIDYNGIISADSNALRVVLDVDAVLASFVKTELSLGNLVLSLNLNDGEPDLSGSLESLGVTFRVSGAETAVTLPDGEGYIDIIAYLNSVNTILRSDTLKAVISLENYKDISEAAITAYVKVGDQLAAMADIGITYKNINVHATAYYAEGIVYLNLSEFNYKHYEAYISCTVNEIRDTVEKLLAFVNGLSVVDEEAPSEDVSVISGIISYVIGLDFNEVINADASSLNVTVNVDEILSVFGKTVDGMTFGDLSLTLTNGVKPKLTGELDELGLNFELCGDDTAIDIPDEEYVEVIKYIDDVLKLAQSPAYLVDLKFDGSNQTTLSNIAGEYADLIGGIYAEISGAQVAYTDGNITVNAPISVTYTDNGKAIVSVELTAYYTITIGEGYGTVYLDITKINGVEFDAKLTAVIDDAKTAVINLLAAINGGEEGDGEGGEPQLLSDGKINVTVASVIDLLLKLDYNKIISADNDSLKLTVNAEEILEGLDIDLGGLTGIEGLTVGTVKLSLVHDNGNPKLTGSLPALGLTLDINGCENTLSEPTASDYLDVVEFIDLITNAVGEVEKIINANDASFSATVTVGEVVVAASGEVSRNEDGKWQVAVSLTVTKNAEEQFSLKFVYDGTAGEGQPIAKLSLDGEGVEIYSEDITKLTDGFKALIGAFKSSDKKDETPEETEETQVQTYAEGGKINASVISDIIDIIANENVQTALKAVLGAVKGLTVTLDGNAHEVVIGFINDGALSLSVSDGLNLGLNYNGATVAVNVKADAGNVYSSVEGSIEVNNATIDEFVKKVYDKMFEKFDGMSLEQLLGSKTYTVHAVLDGSDSNVAALNGIKVDARLTYSEQENGKKLVDALVELDINGTTAKLSASYYNKSFYITLYEVAGTLLNMSEDEEGLKIKADADNIYSAVETLVHFIVDSDIATVITKLLKNGTTDTPSDIPAPNSDKANYTVIDIINVILTMDFGSIVTVDNNTLALDIDKLLSDFNINLGLGKLAATLDTENKTLSATVTSEGKEGAWLTFDANPADAISAVPAAENYLDISFISDLLKDIENTLTNQDNNIHELYSFSGKANINIQVPKAIMPSAVGNILGDINLDIVLDIATLTVGFDGEGEFYFSLIANLHKTMVKSLYPATTESTIAVTYSRGYITMGKNIGTENAVYKVMTLNYLIDNIFAQQKGDSDSPLRWLIGMEPLDLIILKYNIWNLIAEQVPADAISSSLTKPTTYKLFDEDKQEVVEETVQKNVILKDYLNYLMVNLNGETLSDYGTSSDALETFLDNNYYSFKNSDNNAENFYAFEINANKLVSMLDHLYVALYRNDDKGINGFAVEAELKIMSGSNEIKITASINLDNYLEGEDVYNPDDDGTDISGKQAPNFLKVAEKLAGGIDYGEKRYAEMNTENYSFKFGCFDTSSGYSPSKILTEYTLTIVDKITGKTNDVKLKYSSTVDANGFKMIDDNHKYAYYSDEACTVSIGKSFVIDGNITIYASSVVCVDVTLHTVDGSTVIFPMADGEILPDVAVDGYICLGWYTTADLADENEVSVYETVMGTHIYGKYTKESYTGENGVTYTLSTENGAHFVATGLELEEGVTEIELLELEDEIYGVPVTQIAANAFDVNKTHIYIRNIVVPDSVNYVGSLAFLDNVGMRSAVFLASEVTFGGKKGTSSENGYPFYGCSESTDGKTTNLSVYYNVIIAESKESAGGSGDNYVPAWAQFRGFTEGITKKYRYIGHNGGSIGTELCSPDRYEFSYNDGGAGAYRTFTNGVGKAWAYVKYTVNGYEGLSSVAEGFNVIFTTDTVNNVINEINGITAAAHGYINGYTVTASHDAVLNCGMDEVIITVTANEKADYYYELNLTNNGDIDVTLTADTMSFDGKTYVRYDTSATLSPSRDDCEVTSANELTEQVGDNLTFTMPDEAFDLTVICTTKGINEVTIISAVDFTYNGNSAMYNDANNYYTYTLSENVTEDETVLGTVAATGAYSFLGWSYKDGEVLAFDDNTVRHATYYLVWAIDRNGISEYTKTTNGNIPVVEGVGKWYTDSSFNTEVKVLSTANTVLYARLQYTVSVTVNTDNDAGIWYFENYGENYPDGDKCTSTYRVVNAGKTYTAKIEVGENSSVVLFASADLDDAKCLKIECTDIDGTKTYNYLRTKGKSGNGSSGVFDVIDKMIPVTGNVSESVHNNAEACVATGTLVTLADGTQKRIEEFDGTEIVLAWDFMTGKYVEAPISILFYHGEDEYDILNLVFDNGSKVKVITNHGFFDYELNKFVFIDYENYVDFIGHTFAEIDNLTGGYRFTKLVNAYITKEVTGSYSMQTAIYNNFFVENMFSHTIPAYDGLMFFFDMGENMKYDEAKMQADIEKYGLFTYEDLVEYIPNLTYEQFIGFNGAYLKVSVGKGYLTMEQIVEVASQYIN